jgi:hypothetical protein
MPASDLAQRLYRRADIAGLRQLLRRYGELLGSMRAVELCGRGTDPSRSLCRFHGCTHIGGLVGRDRARYLTTRLSIPPVGTVRATFTAHGPRLVGLFSSLSDDMVPCVESEDSPRYPRLLEG